MAAESTSRKLGVLSLGERLRLKNGGPCLKVSVTAAAAMKSEVGVEMFAFCDTLAELDGVGQNWQQRLVACGGQLKTLKHPMRVVWPGTGVWRETSTQVFVSVRVDENTTFSVGLYVFPWETEHLILGWSNILQFGLMTKLAQLRQSEETKEASEEKETVEERRANDEQRTTTEPRVIAAMRVAKRDETASKLAEHEAADERSGEVAYLRERYEVCRRLEQRAYSTKFTPVDAPTAIGASGRSPGAATSSGGPWGARSVVPPAPRVEDVGVQRKERESGVKPSEVPPGRKDPPGSSAKEQDCGEGLGDPPWTEVRRARASPRLCGKSERSNMR